ncbi:MAG: hypothetical protein QXN37_01410 [Candidatus Anstonellaceae archaeon]
MLVKIPYALSFLLFLALAWVYLDFSGKLSDLSGKYEHALSEIRELRANHTQLNSKFEAAQHELASKEQQLYEANFTIAQLRSNLTQKQQELLALQEELEAQKRISESQKEKARQLLHEFQELEKRIADSIQWFRDNSVFPKNYDWKADKYIERVLNDCVDNNELNLGCMSYLMENSAFALHYRNDVESTGKVDFLQSVKQTIDTGWGDCEDYSLVFKAALNSIKSQRPDVEVVTYQPAESGIFYIYPKESYLQQNPQSSYWYVPNARKMKAGKLGQLYPHIVCYPQTKYVGHCAVALSEKEATSSSAIFNLNRAKVFEPQKGGYLGTIGDPSSPIPFELCTQENCNSAYNIIMVISDADLYNFMDSRWVGYQDYLNRIQEMMKGFN